jgi:hypothetical protein
MLEARDAYRQTKKGWRGGIGIMTPLTHMARHKKTLKPPVQNHLPIA